MHCAELGIAAEKAQRFCCWVLKGIVRGTRATEPQPHTYPHILSMHGSIWEDQHPTVQDELARPSKAAEQAPAQGSSQLCINPTHTHAYRGKDFPSNTRRAGREGLGDRGRGMMTAGQRTKAHKPRGNSPEEFSLLPKGTALWAILTKRTALLPP